MLKQQHYTLTNVKKVKSQSTTPLSRQDPRLQSGDIQTVKSTESGWQRPAGSHANLSNRHPTGPCPGGGHYSGGMGPHTYGALQASHSIGQGDSIYCPAR